MALAFSPGSDEALLRARAMRLLARREHSRAELKRKLAPHAGEGCNLDTLLDDFSTRGWLSEERFVEQTVRTKARRFGPLKIAHHLREKGVGEDGIAKALAQYSCDASGRLEAVWKSRFGRRPSSAAEKSRQIRFLQGRGFAMESILALLRDLDGTIR